MTGKVQFAIPIPPLREGLQWNGRSLLNWMVERMGPHEKQALFIMKDRIGPDAFRLYFEEKAKELNERFSARALDPRDAPKDQTSRQIVLHAVKGLH